MVHYRAKNGSCSMAKKADDSARDLLEINSSCSAGFDMVKLAPRRLWQSRGKGKSCRATALSPNIVDGSHTGLHQADIRRHEITPLAYFESSLAQLIPALPWMGVLARRQTLHTGVPMGLKSRTLTKSPMASGQLPRKTLGHLYARLWINGGANCGDRRQTHPDQ